MSLNTKELPAALHNLVDPGAVNIYLNREWQIDWKVVIERRPRLLEHEPELPPYFLLPEIEALLHGALHENVHLMIDTLWHTGARISELLALTPDDFYLDPANNDSFVSLHTLKVVKRGRPKIAKRKSSDTRRMVPLTDARYIDEVQRYFATFRPGAKERLFSFTRQTANNRLKAVAKQLDGLPFLPSAHTLRHSFAINAILHGTPARVLQIWLGHSNIASTEIYTKVLGTETAHFMTAVRYSDEQPLSLGFNQGAHAA